MKAVRVELDRLGLEPCLDLAFVQPWAAWFVKEGEVVGHFLLDTAQALKLSPHEQVVAALGLCTLKPPSCSAFTKSNSEPVT